MLKAIECLEQGKLEGSLTEQGMTGQDGVISGMSCSAKTLSVNLVVARGRCGLLGWAFQVPCYYKYYYWYDTIRAFMVLFFFFWPEITIVRYISAILSLEISSLLFSSLIILSYRRTLRPGSLPHHPKLPVILFAASLTYCYSVDQTHLPR